MNWIACAEKCEKNKFYKAKTTVRWQDIFRRGDDPEDQACVIYAHSFQVLEKPNFITL